MFTSIKRHCPHTDVSPASIVLDVRVDSADKEAAPSVAERAAHEPEREAEDAHVAEVEDCLVEARHLRLDDKVVERVEEDVAGGGGGGGEGDPRPAVVLVVEQEVRDDDGDADGDDGEDEVDEQHEAVDVVKLVVPEGGEDKVHLDEDGAEREHPAQRDEHRRPRVPPLVRYQPRDRVDAARCVGATRPVPPEDGAEGAERDSGEEPDGDDGGERAEPDRAERAVRRRDGVEQQRGGGAGGGEEGGGVAEGADPAGAARGSVEAARDIAGDEGRACVADEEGEEDGAAAHVQVGRRRKENHHEDHHRQLRAGADERREERQVRGRPEHVSMHLLPARLVELCVEVLHVGVSRVPRVVLAEGAEQDERDDAGEEEDHHEGVEDGEPVDLVLEEVVVEVAVEALREGRLRLRPLDRVRQVDLCARVQRDRVLRRQVDLDDARAVVRDREPLVREEERLGLRLVLVAV
mmetsp:Transcript_3072/g.10278  ORF Transcript_3072/g.10278 Transcript_3072/m.10278 type:complete len:465 (+) Transcript_3072:20-1414(+)